MASTPLKNMSQLRCVFPIYGKIRMFQTTNQLVAVIWVIQIPIRTLPSLQIDLLSRKGHTLHCPAGLLSLKQGNWCFMDGCYCCDGDVSGKPMFPGKRRQPELIYILWQTYKKKSGNSPCDSWVNPATMAISSWSLNKQLAPSIQVWHSIVVHCWNNYAWDEETNHENNSKKQGFHMVSYGLMI